MFVIVRSSVSRSPIAAMRLCEGCPSAIAVMSRLISSANYLRNAFVKSGYWADVAVREELSGEDTLRVTFSVLVFPLQTIIVDGQELK